MREKKRSGAFFRDARYLLLININDTLCRGRPKNRMGNRLDCVN